jgi:hypothetical protein
MISVENFYWVLHEQLLKPSGIQADFFYPFGTTGPENVQVREFSRMTADIPALGVADLSGHLVFFYDQEPLYIPQADQVIGPNLGFQWWRWLRILANSEHSAEKKFLLKEHSASDWYYFYHGFAALDWFRDAQYLDDSYNVTHAYLSMNHLISGDRAYRIALNARLAELDVLKLGKVSFHSSPELYQKEIMQTDGKLSTLDKILAKKHSPALSQGLYIDRAFADGNLSAHFGHFEYKLLQSCFLHVVNETVFYHNKLHLTEKIFKPIIARRPFVLVAAPGNLEYFRSYGFQTFDAWIDESYDTEPNNSKRLNMIAQQIQRIAQMPTAQRDAMHQEMQQVLQHNYNHFFGEFRKIIVEELVSNFEKCVRVHNTSRVDERVVKMHPDYSLVKKLLLS